MSIAVIAFFPEHADLFRRNDRLLKDVDRAITELTLRSVNETTKKLSGNITSTPSGPHNVRH